MSDLHDYQQTVRMLNCAALPALIRTIFSWRFRVHAYQRLRIKVNGEMAGYGTAAAEDIADAIDDFASGHR